MFRLTNLLPMAALTASLAAFVPLPAYAQTDASNGAAPAQPADVVFSQEELQGLVAPIALYSDPLLSRVLQASTYPLDIVAAERWLSANGNLKGDALAKAAQAQPWDESVKGLIAVPTVLKMMNDQLEWTQKLGNAVLAQQSDVLAAIQTLRGHAQAKGNLKSGEQQTVSTVDNHIVIEPTQPETVYVPYYDTKTVYGSDWAYASSPPYYWPPPYGYSYPPYGGYGLGFMTGAILGAAWGNGGWWGNGANWGGGYINHYGNVNFNNFNSYRNNIGNGSGNRWNHNAGRRGGVQYPTNALRNQYGRGQLAGAGNRGNFRGRNNGIGNNGLGGRNGLGNNGVGGRNGLGNNGVGGRNGVANRGGVGTNRGNRGGAGVANRGNVGNRGTGVANRGNIAGRNGVANRGSNFSGRGGIGGSGYASRGGGFDGVGMGGSTRNFSSRGRSAMSGGYGGGRNAFGGGGRSSFGGGGRGGFSGGRGGGGRGGGMRGGGGRGGGGRRR